MSSPAAPSTAAASTNGTTVPAPVPAPVPAASASVPAQAPAAAASASPPVVTSGSPTPISDLKHGAADVTAADYYFQSYSHFGIHEEMLKDRIRTLAYRRAIAGNATLFKGRVVLDVGCGTGILCMFAAKAGAKAVYGIECASIAVQARQIVADNKLDHVITIIQGKVEDITLPVDHVDIIVSEWMGYFLLYESMLDTVLFARDKWLQPGTGVILPDRCTMYVCGIEDAEYRTAKLDWWGSVYGFKMTAIQRMATHEPLVDTASAKQVCTSTCKLLDVDVMTVTRDEMNGWERPFQLKMERDDYVHAYVVYFTCDFSLGKEKVHFSTGPTAPYTHWKSTILYLDEPLTACKGEVINGVMRVKKNDKNPRDLDIEVDTEFVGKHDQSVGSKSFRLR